jgi:hypothetical protein
VIFRHQINRLTDEEKGALLYVLNDGSHAKVDIETVTAYKLEAIQKKLKTGVLLIKPEHIEFYEKLCNNFDVVL